MRDFLDVALDLPVVTTDKVEKVQNIYLPKPQVQGTLMAVFSNVDVARF